MDTDWNTGVEVELPLPSHRKSIGDDVSRLENGVMELLWDNGEVVLNKQKSSCKCHYDDDDDEETASWIHCPIDEAFEKEFCSNLIFSDEIAPPNPMTSLPPPRLIIPSRNHSRKGPGESMLTIGGGSSHCGSNNQVEKSHGPRGRRFRLMQVSDKKKNIIISSQSKTTSTELQPITTSSTNDEDTSTSTKRKSRDHEMEDQSECQSDAPESELATGNKVISSQKSGTTRRSRVAQVHNLSERRRRDRINEKMKALQELIPHSNKQSDKASMLDEAIEYMKSLQLQLQLMWNMGSTGMAARPPLMMHQYHPAALLMQQYQYMMSSLMARPTPTPTPTLPQIQNHLMRFLSPPNNNINQPTQNHHSNSSTMFNHHQMQNPNFTHDHNQYANNYNINTFHPMQNTSSTSHPVNMFNLGAQQNHHHHVLAQPNIGNNMDLPS